jgi:ferric-dicitrate binding protein FerR (iron transport regulator)
MSLSVRLFRNASALLVSLILACLGFTDIVLSQTSDAGCVLERVGGTARTILRCRDGLTITAEDGARYTLRDRNRDNSVDTVNLLRKALLLDVPENRTEPRFEVITPLAIAAVRGTKWAVDVVAGKTSVFVIRGSVIVQRPAAGRGVVLGSGDGVDVEPGTGPLTVKRWPVARVSALLARFGQ